MSETNETSEGIKKYRRKLTALVTTLALVGGIDFAISYISKPDEYGTGCEFYQGFTINKHDAEIIYVFDPKPANRRVEPTPEYPLVGDHDLRYVLKIGERYCFKFKEPKFPWSSREIVYVLPEDSVVSQNQAEENYSD